MPKVALILLAAGGSSRMGVPKQLLSLGRKTLLQQVVDQGLASCCRPIVVVLGAHAEVIAVSLAGPPVQIRVNPRWSEGMGTSIRVGIEFASDCGAEAAILALGDQPFVQAATLDQLVRTWLESGRSIVAAEYADTVGVPALFSRRLFPNLLALEPSQGCKRVILDHPHDTARIPCPEAELDLDTPADYRSLSPRFQDSLASLP